MSNLCFRLSSVIPGASAFPLAPSDFQAIVPAPAARPFDALNAAAPAYALHSFRKMLLTYDGPACRLRRSSDNVELNFAPDTLSSVITTWLAGATAFLVRMYDHSGNNRDLYQPSASAQPSIILSGAYPFADFDGSDDYIDLVNGLGFARNRAGLTVAALANPDTVAGNKAIAFWATTGGTSGTIDVGSVSGTSKASFGRTSSTQSTANVPITAAAWHRMIGRADWTTPILSAQIDGTEGTVTASVTTGVTADVDLTLNPSVGRHQTVSRWWDGKFAASAWYTSAISDANRTLLNTALAAISP
ncbi:hypothetical protein SAMN02745157_1538 [Kaistia soli DSM 19436]|uniref:Uncharacterized protein n=1 Tax=Kaistia soli DSM 19436 TaxID=1122133 RepID=A0A1M4YJG2_9HYPH|nr:hypothetical protein [Kaistia soli]SHF05871.1 hypothetical protein SAMN02745157_1538 [Kaistia soli DSM 19436]